MSQTMNEAKPQTPPMPEPAARQHDWLRRMVGEWTYEIEDDSAVKGPKPSGVERVRALGDLWVIGEAEGEMPGVGAASSVTTLGFDTMTQRFVGTWVGSMMSRMWVYDGELNAAGTALALDSVGPSMEADGTLANYRDLIEMTSDDLRTMTAHVQQKDGSWKPFMTLTFRRKTA